MANPLRDGDAKPEVSDGEIARLPAQCVRYFRSTTDRRTRMSKFKFRHAQLMLSLMSLIALVVVSGASWKF